MKPKKTGEGPDWDKYVVDKKSYVTYMTGAKMYGLPYYTFVTIVKSAKANIRVRKGVVVDENDYEPFVKYILGIITAAYREFFDRAKFVEEKKVPKPDRIEELIKNHLGTITKSEIMENTLGISQTTVQRTLTDLVKEGKITKIGGGRYTKYTWNWDKED